MYLIKYSSRFKKDFRRFRHNYAVVSEFKTILELLKQEKKLPDKNRNHRLLGKFKDYYECHLQSDILLVYKIEKSEISILLIRIGSHSELF